jgi:hypothetical protein
VRRRGGAAAALAPCALGLTLRRRPAAEYAGGTHARTALTFFGGGVGAGVSWNDCKNAFERSDHR